MASVTNSNALKYRHLGQDEEGPEKPRTETLRDRLLKGFLKKQMRTNETLEDHYKNAKEFSRASVEECVTASISGLSSFENFKKLQNSLAVKQVLKSSGLTEEEIKILLSRNENLDFVAPVAREKTLKAIEEKLASRQQELDAVVKDPEQFNGAVPLNRHDFEEEINAIPSLEKADKLTACLIRLQPHTDESIPADHPINHIKEIAEELFPAEKTESKKRSYNSDTDREHSKRPREAEPKYIYLTEKPKTLWDMKEIPKIIESSTSNVKTVNVDKSRNIVNHRLYISKREKVNKIDPAKPFVLTLDNADLIPLQVIESNRKSLEELRNMDKFRNLGQGGGEPSKTLYIKNLSHKTSPRDIASLMGHFESKSESKIQYRILNGRMKGQAFVTFQDVATATAAINTCNGYVLHEKPIVIEYGKH